MKPVLNRRELLVLSGGAAAGAVVSAVPATSSAEDMTDLLAAGAGTTVVLQDRRLPLPDELQGRLSGNGARLLPLDEDPVRMWRGEHAALLDHAGTRLLGVTPWIQFVMIQGLAAESRRRVRYQRFDAGSNAMVWLIA